MNVFVLGTGRCGTHTFSKACSHMTNYTAGHQSREGKLGADRIAYPEDHIEADCRLSWFLGELDQKYGDQAKYVHLERDSGEVAWSLKKRWHGIGHIAPVYRDTIVGNNSLDRYQSSLALVETMKANIALFLRDKSNVMHIHLDTAKEQFPKFWRWIEAEGDFGAAMGEWDISHGASLPPLRLAARSMKARSGKAFRAMFPR